MLIKMESTEPMEILTILNNIDFCESYLPLQYTNTEEQNVLCHRAALEGETEIGLNNLSHNLNSLH